MYILLFVFLFNIIFIIGYYIYYLLFYFSHFSLLIHLYIVLSSVTKPEAEPRTQTVDFEVIFTAMCFPPEKTTKLKVRPFIILFSLPSCVFTACRSWFEQIEGNTELIPDTFVMGEAAGTPLNILVLNRAEGRDLLEAGGQCCHAERVFQCSGFEFQCSGSTFHSSGFAVAL